MPAVGPNGHDPAPPLFGASVREILIARGYVTAEEWDAAANRQPEAPETDLVGRGRLTQIQLAEARAIRWGLEWQRLGSVLDPALASEVPDEIRAQWALAVLEGGPERLVVAVADPDPVQLRDALREAARGRELHLVVVPTSDLPPAAQTDELDDATLELEADATRLRALGQDTVIVRLTADIIERGIALGASDIHIGRFDEGGTGCEARFRVDGQLQMPGVSIPRRALPGIISRLLLLAGLDISQHRLPQSGTIPWPTDARASYDLRIETSPDARGEHAVVRVFTHTGISSIEGLGFTDDIARGLDQVSRLPHGLVLICGRTGSGKSTTLAVLVRRIHALSPGKAIYTVEDPVEQAIPGVVQVPVDTRAGRTFQVLLRSALRKNPDVIVVGEIRDLETAQIAVQAALTGHLVLGTLHTNTAAAAVPRLINLGIPHYYVADVLRAVLSQRLVRATCRACSSLRPVAEVLRHALPQLPSVEQQGHGCPACYGGYVGRIPIGEILLIDSRISAMITAQITALEISRLSRSASLFENGIVQINNCRTSVSEVLREAQWDGGFDDPSELTPLLV